MNANKNPWLPEKQDDSPDRGKKIIFFHVFALFTYQADFLFNCIMALKLLVKYKEDIFSYEWAVKLLSPTVATMIILCMGVAVSAFFTAIFTGLFFFWAKRHKTGLCRLLTAALWLKNAFFLFLLRINIQ